MKSVFKAYTLGKHYLPNGKDGIDEIVIDLLKINTKDGSVTYSVILLDESIRDMNLDHVLLYKSPEDFKRGAIECKGDFGVIDELSSAFNRNLVENSVINEDGTVTLFAYFFENGIPVKKPIDIDYITKTKHKYCSADIPEGAYFDYQDCLDWNDVAVNKDGEQYVEKGYKKHLSLTKQQKEIINQIMALKAKFIEAGGNFVWNENNSTLRVFNMSDVEKFIPYWEDGAINEALRSSKHNFVKTFGTEIGEPMDIADDTVYCNGCDKHLIIFKD